MEKLLPCPFCKYEDIRLASVNIFASAYCPNCGAHGPQSDSTTTSEVEIEKAKEEATEKWNKAKR